MTTYTRILALGAFAGLGLLSSCTGSDSIDLKLKLQPGSQYVYTTDNRMTMEQSMMGQSMKTTNNMMMQATYAVDAAEGQNKKLTVTYDRITLETAMPMGQIKYDSDKPEASDPALSSLTQILHKPFSMTVTERGDITNVSGLDAIINAVGDTSTQEGAMARAQMANMFNDTAVKSMMQQSFNIFPDKAVKPGDTWKKSVNVNLSSIAMKMDNTYKLTSVSNGVAHIDVNSVVTAGGDMASEQMKNMQIKLSGDQKGTMDVDIATGMVSDSKLKQTISGDMTVSEMKIPIKISQDIHLTAKKK